MTVTTTQSRITYAGDGVSLSFPIPFMFVLNTDIGAVTTDSLGNVVSQVYGANFTLSGANVPSGGTYISSVAIPVGTTLSIFGNPPLEQFSVYTNNSIFPAATVEDDFDRQTLISQRIVDILNRTFRGSDGDTNITGFQLPPAAQRANTSPGFDASGNPTLVANLSTALTQSIFNAFLLNAYPTTVPFAQTAAEVTAGVTPVNYGYAPGDIRRYGGSGDNGLTDNTTALQNALNANAGAFTVTIPAAGYYKVNGRITAPANTHIRMESAAEIRWTSTSPTGSVLLGAATSPGIEVTGDSFFLEGKGKLTGPSVATYVSNECGILRVGTSAASRGTGFIVRDVDITQWGAYGIVLQFMQTIEVTGVRSHHNGYMGLGFLSCQYGRVKRCKLHDMTPGTSSNMYGLSCTHDSTNYNLDPNVTVAPRQTVNPFCIDFDVSENEVYGVNWIGLDAHGGYELNYHDNKVYDCYIGIQVASGSNAAAAYAGEDNKVCHNTVYTTQINGNATTTSGHSGLQFGITVNGGATLSHRGVEVIGNTIVGAGDVSGAGGLAYSIQCSNMQDAVILGNSIRNWSSVGIYGTVFDGTISSNVFNAPANTALTKCIWVDSNSLRCTINGNRLELHGGSAPLEGIRFASSGSQRPVVSGNLINQATTPYSGDLLNFSQGLSDVVPLINDSTTGSHTLDVSVFGVAPRGYIAASQGSAAALTSLLNPQIVGQEVTIFMSGGSTLTVNNSGNIKLQGGTAALTSNSTLTLVCTNVASPQWQEKCRAIGNT